MERWSGGEMDGWVSRWVVAKAVMRSKNGKARAEALAVEDEVILEL